MNESRVERFDPDKVKYVIIDGVSYVRGEDFDKLFGELRVIMGMLKENIRMLNESTTYRREAREALERNGLTL